MAAPVCRAGMLLKSVILTLFFNDLVLCVAETVTVGVEKEERQCVNGRCRSVADGEGKEPAQSSEGLLKLLRDTAVHSRWMSKRARFGEGRRYWKNVVCNDREVVPSLWVCDGTADCMNSEDESGCLGYCGDYGYPVPGCECDVGFCMNDRPSPVCACGFRDCLFPLPRSCRRPTFLELPAFHPSAIGLKQFQEPECQVEMDLIFLLDGSASVGHLNFEKEKKFCRQLVSDFDIGPNKTRVATIQYSIEQQDEFWFDLPDVHTLRNALGQIVYMDGPGTETGKAIMYMASRFPQREGAKKIAIVITDGKNNPESRVSVRMAADRAREDGITLYAVGVGTEVDLRELTDLAGDPTRVYNVEDFQSLSAFAEQGPLQTELCLSEPTTSTDNQTSGSSGFPGVSRSGPISSEDLRTYAIISCSSFSMQVDFPRMYFPQVYAPALHLADPSCTARGNSTHVSILAPLVGCGTTSSMTADFILYRNKVIEDGGSLPRASTSPIVRACGFELDFTCQMPRHKSVLTGYNPVLQPDRFYEQGTGKLQAVLRFCRDASCLSYNTDSPLVVKIGGDVIVEIELLTSDPDLSIMVEDCVTTDVPTSTGGGYQYQIIQEGCGADPTYHQLAAPRHSVDRFKFQAFNFVSDVTRVYLRCSVLVCRASQPGNRCAHGCMTHWLGKRSVVNLDDIMIHVISGPLVLLLPTTPRP
ncbi:PREDICTED: uncharacterized protein LOC109467934 [Branchiostoma belcheri]|uniref:Uncharacterized protein LOC109467934 n=1 Tax=Branchiostoma belcheri TaxID=7741 RepID=A0A6P4YB36_BRABE|nr:PREDICTED: uncharacterized protein LOC109467934 [Branchiostoma belcheri]